MHEDDVSLCLFFADKQCRLFYHRLNFVICLGENSENVENSLVDFSCFPIILPCRRPKKL
jgi:hypothetical protein